MELLLARFGRPVLCFHMNIPGPVKTTPRIRSAFDEGVDALRYQLTTIRAEILYAEEIHEDTGDELLMVVDLPGSAFKEMTFFIEERHRYGALFLMDVIDEHGSQVPRPTYRKCMICGRNAAVCGRTGAHSTDEMLAAIEGLLGG